MDQIFINISLIVVLVALVSLVMVALRQPLIIGYILTGVLVGPLAFNIIHGNDAIDVFAHFGVGLLLFIIGLGLNPKVIKNVGRVAIATGLGQVTLTTGLGWLIGKALGFNDFQALIVGLALAFSSTIIVLKILSDKKETSRLYGQVAIGFLLVQDVLAALVLVVVSASLQDGFSIGNLGLIGLKAAVLIGGLFLIARYILPASKPLLAGSQEILFLFSLAWGFGIGYLFDWAGFSLEVGALAAGVVLAGQSFASSIAFKLRPLRDFFIIMFFVSIGAHLQLVGLVDLLPQAILLSLLVMVGNPIIVMAIMGWLGFSKKTAFKSGLAVAQISEFSLILVTLTLSGLGARQTEISNLIILVALITITCSSYMMIYADRLYQAFSHSLGIFQRRRLKHPEIPTKVPEFLLVGYVKGGEQFVKAFNRLAKDYLVIDYSPTVVDQLDQKDIPSLCGDITEAELLAEIAVDKLSLVVLTLSDFKANLFVIDWLTKHRSKAVIICSADSPQQARELYDAGASYVMIPHYIGNRQVLHFIRQSGLNKTAFLRFKKRQLTNLARLEKIAGG